MIKYAKKVGENLMQSDKFRKKKQIFHILNILSTLIIIALSGLSIYIASQSKNDNVGGIFGILSCVFGGIALILGALLPSKEENVYLSGGTKITLVVLNLLLNDYRPSPSIMDKNQLYRSWNYTGMVILSIFMIIFNAFGALLADFNEYSAAACIGLIVFWLLLDVGAGFWTYYDAVCTGFDEECGISPIECGKKAIHDMARNTLIIVVIFGVVSAVAYFTTEAQYKPVVDTGKINEEINEAMDKLNQLDSDDFFVHEEYDSVSDAVLSLKGTYGDTKYYYILQYNDSNGLNIISWTDESDKIYVDSFDCNDDGSVVNRKSFVSSAITKADVEGKQDGVIE